MFWNCKQLVGLSIEATDGSIGKLVDLYFDQRLWQVQHVVIDTGEWLSGAHVSLSPESLRGLAWQEGVARVALTREQVAASPAAESDAPASVVSQGAMVTALGGLPAEWHGPELWSPASMPAPLDPLATPLEPSAASPGVNPSLRSAEEIRGYYIAAVDGDIGHIEDLLIDDESWAIRYVIVDTANWWFGKHVLLAPSWVRQFDWATRKVHVDVSRDVIRAGPAFDVAAPLSREYERELYQHYGRPPYWPE